MTTSSEPDAAEQDHEPLGSVTAARWNRGWLMALLPAGFLLGVLGGFLQEHRLAVGPIDLPWAAVLVVAALVSAIRAASLNLGTRLAGGLWYGGWLIATALLALPNPSGDVIFTEGAGSLGYLLAGSLLGAAAAVWPLFLDTPAAQVPTGGTGG
jgi:hypothetical protein